MPRRALERCVGDIDCFEREHWGRSPLIRRSDGDDFIDVWSIAALDEFIVGGIRRPLVRLVADGTPVPPNEYTSRARLGGTEFDDVVDPGKVARRFASGATVVAQSIHRTHAGVRRFTEDLADSISHPVQANSYLTPAGACGLAPHRDRHDVFVLQVEGSKSWYIEGVGELELRAGDTGYIPAGTRHAASSTSEPSLHLTIGVLRVTYRAVLQRLLRDGPDLLDEPLPLRYRTASDELSSGIVRMLDEVVVHLGAVDAADVMAHEVGRTPTRPPRAGGLVAAASLAAIDASTVIACGGSAWTLSAAPDDRVEVAADGSFLTAPVSCRPALEQIASSGPVRVGTLVGLDAGSRVILGRRLVAAGLCAVVPGP